MIDYENLRYYCLTTSLKTILISSGYVIVAARVLNIISVVNENINAVPILKAVSCL
jgi:hypothetical protein